MGILMRNGISYTSPVPALETMNGVLPVTSGGTGAMSLNNIIVGRAISDASGNNIVNTYVNKAGDTMTGSLTLSSGSVTTSAGSIYAGTEGDTAAERQVVARSGAGSIYLYSQASATGNRGLYLSAHGTGSALSAISVNTNNEVTFNGKHATLTGNISAGGNATIGGRVLIKNNNRYPHINFVPNTMTTNANYQPGSLRYDVGSTTTYSTGQFVFRQYSPNATPDLTHTGYYEDFKFPSVAVGLTQNENYNVYTTKTLTFSLSGTTLTITNN